MKKYLTAKNIILGLISLYLLVKVFSVGVGWIAIWALYKKQIGNKVGRACLSAIIIMVCGVIGIVNSVDDSTATTAAPKVEQQTAAPTAAAPKEEEAAPKAPEEAPAPQNIIKTIPEAEAMEHIKAQAKIDWATDFEEQKYIIGQQTEAYNNLKALVIDTPEKEMILNQAHSDWGYDFEETLYIYNEQLKAYNELNK